MNDTDIRRVEPGDLAAIVSALSGRTELQHLRRLQAQDQGHGVYLIAWRQGTPAGHVMLKWPAWPERRVSELTARYGCSWAEDLAVQPQSRNQGIGRRLMETLETLTRDHGIRRVGLDVGLDQGYTAARRLYESLSYRDMGHGIFMVSDREGGRVWMEWLVSLLKELR